MSFACPGSPFCDLPERLKTSTSKLQEIKRRSDALNQRLAQVEGEIAATGLLAKQAQAQGVQALNLLDIRVQEAISDPNPDTIGAALAQLQQAQNLQENLVQIRERERVYQNMLETLAAQVQAVEARSEQLTQIPAPPSLAE